MALAQPEQSLALDPQFAAALANAAWCYEQRLSRHWPRSNESQRPVAMGLARHALAQLGRIAPEHMTEFPQLLIFTGPRRRLALQQGLRKAGMAG